MQRVRCVWALRPVRGKIFSVLEIPRRTKRAS